MVNDKRFYTRYSIRCDCIIATESGRKYEAEVLDISAEGAKIRSDEGIHLKIGDIIYLNIKCKFKIKVKAEIRWIKSEDRYKLFGVRFIDMTIQDRDSLSRLLSEMALANLDDSFLR